MLGLTVQIYVLEFLFVRKYAQNVQSVITNASNCKQTTYKVT